MITTRQMQKRIDKVFFDLNKEIEGEMLKIIESRHNIVCVLKCMGQITLYSTDGSLDYVPSYARRLFNLADMDYGYLCLTGKPLKLYRDGAEIRSKTDW